MPLKRRGEQARLHPDRRLDVPEPDQPAAQDEALAARSEALAAQDEALAAQDEALAAGDRSAAAEGEARRPSFEDLVERALNGLPERFKVLLDDVAIVIEDVPSRDQLGYAEAPTDGWLYGLYEGVPATEYGADWAAIPNKITLFQVPLESDFPDPAELEDEVQRTVIHELAHHAGIDDERLHELDYD